MLLALVCVLLVLGWALARLRWRRMSITFSVSGLALLLLVGCGPLPAWMLSDLQQGLAHDFSGWGQRNVIVLLGAGTVRSDDAKAETPLFAFGRIEKAVQLYRECRAHGGVCRVEISGGDARGLGESEASVYRRVLLGLGVEAGDILLEPKSMNTWQNAQFSGALLRRFGADRVVLVSSATHLRRAGLYFSHFGVVATPVRADWLAPLWSVVPQGYNFTVGDVALHEYLGIARFHLYQAMGWNVEATRPGAL